jgi:predicted anti-sigma-YlaC factor YlaD
MDCRELEAHLEALVEGSLTAGRRLDCQRHLENCGSCRELVELARLPEMAGAEVPDLVGPVLARTSGAACDRAEMLLARALDGALPSTERQLLASHTAVCAECRALTPVLEALSVELPKMAELRPDRRFVADVLAVTLPVGVQLRRWWSRVWPQWVRRPRFASEAAYVGLLVLVVIFSTPGSPLAAVPKQALDAAQRVPSARLEVPVEQLQEHVASTAEAIRSSRGGRTAAKWQAAGAEVLGRAGAVADEMGEDLGTFWAEVASLLGKADEEPSSASKDSNEETS